jgi:hypothetical protein
MLRAGSAYIYAGVLLNILPNSAAAQQMQGCEEHEKIVRRLETKFQEERAEVGTNQYGWLIELFESADGKTWTLVATRPGGPAWSKVTLLRQCQSAVRFQFTLSPCAAVFAARSRRGSHFLSRYGRASGPHPETQLLAYSAARWRHRGAAGRPAVLLDQPKGRID